MSRAFQDDYRQKLTWEQAEHAIEYNGKQKFGKHFYHTFGERFMYKVDAVTKLNRLRQLGYGVKLTRASPSDPRYVIWVRRK